MAHRFPDGSWGDRVRGVYKKPKECPSSLDRCAGDGRYGYRTRPRNHGVVEVIAWDGQPLIRSTRKSAVGKRKAGCRLASSTECLGRDLVELRERIVETQRRIDLERDCRPRFRARKGQKPVSGH